MSNSSRPDHTLFVVALSIIFVLGTIVIWFQSSDQGPTTVDYSYEASEYHNRATNRIRSECDGLDIISLTKCSANIENAERQNHRAERDLRAQQFMAIWAFLAAGSGVGVLLVTALGITWIRATVDQTNSVLDAANRTNEIMLTQSAGYLTIEKVEVQTRRSDVLVYATVKNIGQRPVRTGTIKGNLQFICPIRSEDGIPKFKFIRAKTEVFVGVVEAGQQSRGLSMLTWSEITEDYAAYENHIYAGDAGIDFDCQIGWSESIMPSGGERHILHPLNENEVLESGMGRVVTLTVAYSGMSRDREENKAKQRD